MGKGLVSLMGEADAETAAMKSDSVLPISKVKPNKGQPRKTFDETELSELADSIKQNGILQPILVRKHGTSYEIVAGERRYQAAKLAGLDEVPVVIREISDEDVFKLALIENLQRSNLTPLEEARGYRQLLDEKDLTQEELSKILSKSRSAITNTLRLMNYPPRYRTFLRLGASLQGTPAPSWLYLPRKAASGWQRRSSTRIYRSVRQNILPRSFLALRSPPSPGGSRLLSPSRGRPVSCVRL